jgi:hypothetical protein
MSKHKWYAAGPAKWETYDDSYLVRLQPVTHGAWMITVYTIGGVSLCHGFGSQKDLRRMDISRCIALTLHGITIRFKEGD